MKPPKDIRDLLAPWAECPDGCKHQRYELNVALCDTCVRFQNKTNHRVFTKLLNLVDGPSALS